jgi:hypothetical protein
MLNHTYTHRYGSAARSLARWPADGRKLGTMPSPRYLADRQERLHREEYALELQILDTAHPEMPFDPDARVRRA